MPTLCRKEFVPMRRPGSQPRATLPHSQLTNVLKANLPAIHFLHSTHDYSYKYQRDTIFNFIQSTINIACH